MGTRVKVVRRGAVLTSAVIKCICQESPPVNQRGAEYDHDLMETTVKFTILPHGVTR